MPKLIQNQCQKSYEKREESQWKHMKNEKAKKVYFGADRRTVVQIQGSRGLVTERSLHQKSEENQ